MKFIRAIALPFAFVATLSLAACAGTAQLISSAATQMSSATPQQVTTLAEAYSAATVLTEAVDVYVKVGKPDRATLLQLQKLNVGVHDALNDLKKANDAGKSLAFAAFNEALKAFNAYATAKGIAH